VTGVYDNLFTGPRAAAYVPSGDTAVLYDMDDSPGSISIADRSGNGMDLLGSVSVFADDAGPRGLRAAASFPHVEGAAGRLPMRALSAAESAKFSVGCFTLEAWLKVSGNQPRAGIFELGKAGAGKIQFGLDGGRLMLKASGLNFAGPIATGKLEWSPDQWYHVAVLVDAGDPSTPEDAVTVCFYCTPAGQADGRRARLVSELTGTGMPEAVAPGARMVLGDLDGSDVYILIGTMDEVRFTNRALGPEEFSLVAPAPERPATAASQP
jgi:hypothetical protein